MLDARKPVPPGSGNMIPRRRGLRSELSSSLVIYMSKLCFLECRVHLDSQLHVSQYQHAHSVVDYSVSFKTLVLKWLPVISKR